MSPNLLNLILSVFTFITALMQIHVAVIINLVLIILITLLIFHSINFISLFLSISP